ncbi:hypothetical protein [Bacillus sp. JJ722]|uniref:hypothetical protein n=1 Tax=Bacillus sp. JJ722 TaxID=3122973 RepID=UPI002FFDCA52
MMTYLSKVSVANELMIYTYGLTSDKIDGLIEINRLDFSKKVKFTLASGDTSRGYHMERAIASMFTYHQNNVFPDYDLRASG